VNDPLYEACDAFLSNRHTVLWSDFDLTRPDRKEKAVLWLRDQIQGVAEHYDATQTPFFAGGRLTGPYSTEQGGGGQRPDGKRPSALVTHGQQPERW